MGQLDDVVRAVNSNKVTINIFEYSCCDVWKVGILSPSKSWGCCACKSRRKASQEKVIAESNGKSNHSTAYKTTPGAGIFFREVVKTRRGGKRNVLIFSILSFIFNEHISVVPAVIRKTRQNVFQILALVSLEKRDPREAFAPFAYLTTPRANQPLENFARETFRTSAYL